MDSTRHHWSEPLRRAVPQILILGSVASLCILGLLILFSIGRASTGSSASYAIKQSVWMAIAFGLFLVTLRIRLEKLREFAPAIALLALGLLVAVLIPGIGEKINGARRWIDLRIVPMNLQVSDIAKVALVFVLAHYLAQNQRRIGEFLRGYIIPGFIIGVPFLLILAQPDYGTAALLGAVGACMLFLAGARLIYLIPTGLLAVALFVLAIAMDPVRLRRITSFLDIEGNRGEGAYQLWQGILSFGVGGTTGVGLGRGLQQMSFLPEAHTDFIFAIVGEELGFVTTAAVVLLFVLFFGVVVWQLRKAPNPFQFLLVSGSALFITLQALINFCVVTGCLPTKGMSLPFISYGGSNLVSMFLFLGIILNCFHDWHHLRVAEAGEVMD